MPNFLIDPFKVSDGRLGAKPQVPVGMPFGYDCGNSECTRN